MWGGSLHGRQCAFLTELWGALPPCSHYWKRIQVSTSGGFPGHSAAKNLPAMQEMRVQLLHWEDPLEKETATQSSILAWETPWTEEPRGLQSMGSQRDRHNLATQQQQ